MRARLFSLVCLFALVVAGCGTSPTPAGESPELPPLDPQEIPTQLIPATPMPDLPTQGDTPSMIPSTPNLEKLITKAMEALAQQLSITSSQINLIEATEVTWPNASLGCPQEGMAYAEVLTPGYLILLGYNGDTFEYHASKDSIVTCKNPSPPVPGAAGNT